MSLPVLVGHRGARGEAPENTLPSFQVALDAGLRAMELDVRLSRDGQLMVFHDPGLARTTGHKDRLRRLDAATLQQLDARLGGPGWPEPTPIPTLEQVVALCGPDTHFQFEVKGGEDVRHLRQVASRLAALIAEQELHDRVVVTSSDRNFLALMRRTDPDQVLGLVADRSLVDPVKRCLQSDARWLIANFRLVTPSLVQRARQAGLTLSVWTVNDLVEADRLTALGVDSIITDYASGFAAHFAARRQRAARAHT